MTEHDYLLKTGAAIKAYLNTLSAVSEAIVDACPEIGTPYGHRIKRLRERLAFDPKPEAIEENAATVKTVLEEYAEAASLVSDRRNTKVRQRLSLMGDHVRKGLLRNIVHANHQAQFAAQLENAERPATPERFQDFIQRESVLLHRLIEEMTKENKQILESLRDELISVDRRISGEVAVDEITGLISAEEAARRIATYRADETPFTQIEFEIVGPTSPDILRQIGVRISSQFRPQDLTTLQGRQTFLVIFHGRATLAQARVPYVIPWVAGTYQREDGEIVEISVQVRFPELEQADLPMNENLAATAPVAWQMQPEIRVH